MIEELKESHARKAVYLLERTKDAVSNIIGFYSSEDLAIAAVKRHVEATIDKAVNQSHEETGQHTGIYIQEGFMISKNDVEIDDDVDFDKIEDPDEFARGEDLDTSHLDEAPHVAEDLGDLK